MKPVLWIGNTLKELRTFPKAVRQEAGFAIRLAQFGDRAVNAVPMVGFGGAKVLEVVMHSAGNTFRAVYTAKFQKAIYTLHVFQKKSKKGSKTPQADMNLIRSRLKAAQQHYRENFESVHNEEQADGKGA